MQKQDGKFGFGGFAKGCKPQIRVLQPALLNRMVFCFCFCPLDRTFATFWRRTAIWILSEICSWINATLCERLAVGIFPLSFAALYSKSSNHSHCRITALVYFSALLRTSATTSGCLDSQLFLKSAERLQQPESSSPRTYGLTNVTKLMFG